MTKQQRLVLVISILAAFVAFLDGAIVNVALPAIQRDMGGGLATQQWVVDAYLLTLGSLILVAGSLSDLLGRTRILKLGLVAFGVTSILCAIAPNAGSLIVFRALQGIAGALLVPSSLAFIIANFASEKQAKAIGSWTAWTGIAYIFGPLLGGLLVDQASWRWIFAINVLPIAISLYLLSFCPKPTPSDEPRTPVDGVGAILCALGLGGPVFALIEQSHYGWGSPLIYLPFTLGILVFIGFLVFEGSTKYPMLPLSLFRIRNFTFGNLATVGIYAGLSIATFITVLFLQQVSGYSAFAAGLSFLPVTILMFLLSPRFGALAGKFGPRFFMTVGPLLAACGFLLLLRVGAHVNYWTDLFPAVLLFGLGLSATVAPLTAAVLGSIPTEEAGIASAVNNAVARVAGLLAIAGVGTVMALQFVAAMDQKSGTAVPASVVATAKQTPLQTTPPAPEQHNQAFHETLTNASVAAFHAGVLTMSALLAAGGVISFIGIRSTRPAPVLERRHKALAACHVPHRLHRAST